MMGAEKLEATRPLLDISDEIRRWIRPRHSNAKMIGAKPGEAVWFSFITFKSRAHRVAVNKKVMAYFEKKYGADMEKKMPFDMKRFAYAGFKVEVGV